jgi:hypothetical protein
VGSAADVEQGKTKANLKRLEKLASPNEGMPIFRKLPKSRQQFSREGICRLDAFETARVDLQRPNFRNPESIAECQAWLLQIKLAQRA